MLYVVIALVVGEVVAFAVLVPLASKVSMQASQGQKARATQCLRDPVSQKIASAAFAVRRALPPASRITPEELAHFKATAPKGCPKP